jgi:hypothetical protein
MQVKPFLSKKTQARTHHAVKALIPRARYIVANSIFHNFFPPFSGLFHIRPHQIYKITEDSHITVLLYAGKKTIRDLLPKRMIKIKLRE